MTEKPTTIEDKDTQTQATDIPVFCAYDKMINPLDLIGNPRNPNNHPKEQIKLLAHIIQSQGWRAPITVSNRSGYVVRGHGRLQAALQYNADLVPVDYQDYKTEAEEYADLIADNRIAELAVINEEQLTQLLAELSQESAGIDAELTGYTTEQIAGLIEKYTDNSEQARQAATLTLQQKFIISPFSVMDARAGIWAERKKAWRDLGIKSEIGRGSDEDKTESGLVFARSSQPPSTYEAKNAYEMKTGKKISWEEFANLFPQEMIQTGTSIFDPVLCEVIYRWFCPQGGTIIDPFAGGSVRGIVAALTGRQYTGIDLSERQIEANKENWEELRHINITEGATAAAPITEDKRELKTATGEKTINVSGKWARHEFACTENYIKTTCHGTCCQGAGKVMISLLPHEAQQQEKQGYATNNGMLQPDPKTGKCPHKQTNGLCGLHNTGHKPFGCIASPFTLNDSDTLIIRNRYNMMKCHGTGQPAYKTFRASLDLILGNEAERVIQQIEAGKDNIKTKIPAQTYENLKYLDSLKHADATHKITVKGNEQAPRWITGDSINIQDIAPGQYDLIFTCPPYANLEVYSDAPEDISNKDYPEFIRLYREIIEKTAALLKPNRFACVVVGEVRDKQGSYYNFVSDTIKAFTDAGLKYYNEAILIMNFGSLPIRAGKQFKNSRKVGKTHQNILMFVNGNPEETGLFDYTEPGVTETDIQKYLAQTKGKLGKTHSNVLVFTNGDPEQASEDIGTPETEEDLLNTDNSDILNKMLGISNPEGGSGNGDE